MYHCVSNAISSTGSLLQNNFSCKIAKFTGIWITVCVVFQGGKVEYIAGMNLHHSLQLVSACGYPRYTNFVAGFSGCLDYIYVDRESLKVAKVVPLPSHEDVTLFTALPNAVFPSDHLPLICDLEWSGASQMPDSS